MIIVDVFDGCAYIDKAIAIKRKLTEKQNHQAIARQEEKKHSLFSNVVKRFD